MPDRAPTSAGMTTCTASTPLETLPAATRERAELPCTRPIAMRDELSGMEIQVRCGARLAEDCPTCAARYTMKLRRYQGENLGIKSPGGDLIDPERAGKHALFATGTLPSFGRVLTAADARRDHFPEAAMAGAPADPGRYGYIAHVLHHLLESQLLNVWAQSTRRWAARLAEMGWRVAVATNREEQARRAGHWHAIITVGLDGTISPHPGYRRTGPRRKVPCPHSDPACTEPVVTYDCGLATHVTWLGPKGTCWWEQGLEPVRVTPKRLLASFRQEVGFGC